MVGDGETSRRRLTTRLLGGLVVAALLSVLLTLFVLDNFVLIEVRLMNLRIQARLSWVVILCILGGGAIGFLLGRYLR